MNRFPATDRERLLAVKGVGPTVLARLEQMGIRSLSELAKADVDSIVESAAGITGSTCWKNSPQAREAIRAAIDCARETAAA
ncbi:MAG: helix-hairpin-helix domain-containing protein [Lysobacteraceae bacterium]